MMKIHLDAFVIENYGRKCDFSPLLLIALYSHWAKIAEQFSKKESDLGWVFNFAFFFFVIKIFELKLIFIKNDFCLSFEIIEEGNSCLNIRKYIFFFFNFSMSISNCSTLIVRKRRYLDCDMLQILDQNHNY